MGRRKRTTFGDVRTTRSEFERSGASCPNCRGAIGPKDELTLVRGFGGNQPTLATMRCGRCTAELTVHFLEQEPAG